MACSSSGVSNTRPAPNRRSSPLVTPYTPPLRATSSPNTSIPGRAASASASAALIDWASVSGPASSGSLPANTRCRSAAGAATAARAATTVGRRGASGAITWAARRQPRHVRQLGGHRQHRGFRPLAAGDHLVGGDRARLDQQPRGAEQRVARLRGGDVGRAAVGGLGVRAGVPAQPGHRQVQERRRPALPDMRRGGRRGVVDVGQIRAVRVEVRDAGPSRQGGPHPAGRRPHADAEPVVLAYQQQRQRQALVGAVGGGVERASRGGMVHRGVTERAHHDRVVGQVGRRPGPPGLGPGGGRQAVPAFGREGQADRPRQVRGDRRGLRDDRQLGAAEHLVPAAGDRLRGRRHQPEQHVPQPAAQGIRRRARLAGPGEVERA